MGLKQKEKAAMLNCLISIYNNTTIHSDICISDENRSFSVEEAYSIKDNLFPEADMRYLFQVTTNEKK